MLRHQLVCSSIGIGIEPQLASLSREITSWERNKFMSDSAQSSWYQIQNAADIPSPALLVYPDRIKHNLQQMIAWGGVEVLRPHVKTHKMSRVVQLKLDAGITKFKAATIAEAEMTAAAGGKDILVAYPCVGPNQQRLLRLISTFPETAFSTLVDDFETAQSLSQAAAEAKVEIPVYLDLNVGMDRTGIAPGPAAEALYGQLAELPGLMVTGLHVYDGHIHGTDDQVITEAVDQAFAPAWQMRANLLEQGLPVPHVVGCGTTSSCWMAGVVDRQTQSGGATVPVEVSAGTSVLWDAGQDGLSPPMGIQNAAVLLARVISRPTEKTICIDLGHKAVASEMQPPRVQFFGLPDAKLMIHSEEHLVLEVPDADRFPVGTVLYGVPTHICPTVALHEVVYCVNGGQVTETWQVDARKRVITI